MNRYCALLGLFLCTPAVADIYKCVGADGRVTYTNSKPASGQGCSLLSREQPAGGNTATPKAARPPGAENFPKVGEGEQKARDDERRRILEQELSNEEKLLADAKRELAEQEAVRLGDERNYQKVLDRLQPFKDAVELHGRNIESIRKEIGRLR